MTPSHVCVRCVMDTTDPGIEFDAQGICNHCRDYDAQVPRRLLPPEQARQQFQETIGQIKHRGRGRNYDCVLGISGGTDSSYLALVAWRQGLRTLLVHLDNGWDSELAVNNIENIVKTTGFDYHNHVVDWEEFRDLQVAYLRASVVDVEVVTDQAITALVYRAADRFRTPSILGGSNFITESIMPRGWSFNPKNDLANLRAIHRRFGTRRLKSYPTLSLAQLHYYEQVRKIHTVYPLDHMPYRLSEVVPQLEAELRWRSYGGKHWESVFTKFYQAYILPVKFHIDKRKAHLSNLILSGQTTRAAALQQLAQPIYREDELAQEYAYVIKKLGFSRGEFEQIMAQPPVAHDAYPTERTRLAHRFQWKLWTVIGKLIPG